MRQGRFKSIGSEKQGLLVTGMKRRAIKAGPGTAYKGMSPIEEDMGLPVLEGVRAPRMLSKGSGRGKLPGVGIIPGSLLVVI